MTTYRARFLVTEDGVVEDAVFGVENGRFSLTPSGSTEIDLGRVAVVPGLVNAHSHAFQRVIRGRTEFLDAQHLEEDFWSWRNLMYRAALALGPDAFGAVARATFLEMAKSGITAVGEFHYVHHQQDGDAYPDANELAHRVIQAARDVGIRITLLRVAYHRGGHELPAGDDQRRFVEVDVKTYLERVESLAAHWSHDVGVSVGMAPHSIRAVPRSWLEAIAAHGSEHNRVIHIHACEQRREIEESIAEYGVGPIQAFADLGLLGERTTIVHGTHLADGDVEILSKHGSTVCACPTTERNLGDGFLPATDLVKAGIPISLGSDSQAQIDLWVEMRLVEYHERLRAERRNVLAGAQGTRRSAPESDQLATADVLWPMATINGSRSIGLDVGRIADGLPADFVTVNLRHPALAGAHPNHLLSDLVFSGVASTVRDVFVDGECIVSDGKHADGESILDGLEEVMGALDDSP